MKITKAQLTKIIKEEISKVLEESYYPRGTDSKHIYLGPDDEFEAWKKADLAKDKEREREDAQHPNFMDEETWFLKIGQHIDINAKRLDNQKLRSATPDQYRYWLARKKKERASRRKANPPGWDPRGWFK